MWPFKKNRRGTWEEHPCVLPGGETLQNSHIGCVWRCGCSRRWLLTGVTETRLGFANAEWVEVDPESPINLDEDAVDQFIVELERHANGGQRGEGGHETTHPLDL